MIFQWRSRSGRSVLKGSCLWITHVLCMGYKNLHNYTTLVGWCQDGVKVKSMIDLVLMKKDMLHFVQHVRAMG